MTIPGGPGGPQAVPRHASFVLVALILAAAVANLNLAVANVALPTIGRAFNASQAELNLIAVGYSLGLAASVLYLGALGDRYGRKLMLLAGSALSLPFSFLAAYSPNADVLITARILGGVAGGMCYPTTLALITALWSGAARTRSIALWSAVGAAFAALGPLMAGILLRNFWWGSVFLLTVPIAVAALVMAWRYVPAQVNETTEPVDHLGGALSIVLVGALILGINVAVVPNSGTLLLILALVTLAALAAFVVRQLRAANPLYSLTVAGRPTFWVAALAGIIVFGSLMGAMFVGQQFLQNVLGYTTLTAGAAVLPAAVLMVVVAPRSAKLVESIGSRRTLLLGYLFVLLAFLTMLLLWKDGAPYWPVALGYGFVGIGVGFAQTPAAHSLTGSVPPARAGMASGTADLQRDLGGALMQSVFGALLTAGYAREMTKLVGTSDEASAIADSTKTELTKSFSSAADTATRYPQYASQITSAAKTAFLHGDHWAYTAGILATAVGAAIVLAFFPDKTHEADLLRRYHAQDTSHTPPPEGD
ncbi:MFS transporter [Streptomyces sp. NPDC046866]|uniref:MFS transporter n=1 Tax=Streptomyces sp. NPDC046866 TaxID=3154921 RepID=UPI003451F17B